MKFVCETLSDTKELATQIYRALPMPSILAIRGPLGAGKTTFVKYCLANALDTEVITSPTFNIINVYKTKTSQTILHLDLYRIESYTELYHLGLEDHFNNSIMLMEWPDLFFKAFNIEDRYSINITTIPNSSVREFEILGLEINK